MSFHQVVQSISIAAEPCDVWGALTGPRGSPLAPVPEPQPLGIEVATTFPTPYQLPPGIQPQPLPAQNIHEP